MDVSEIIKELNRLISEKYKDFKGCYLYGSRAKGTHKENSDIDLVALFDEIDNDKDLDVCGIIGRIEYKYNVFIDIQTYTPDALQRNPFYFDEVSNKGIFYEPA